MKKGKWVLTFELFSCIILHSKKFLGGKMKLAIIGNVGGTGKTTIAVHIAGAIAEKEKVCLIDGDYAQLSALHWIFGRGKEAQIDVGQMYQSGNIYGIAFGIKELLTGIKEMEKKFKYVIIDGRPEPVVNLEIVKAMNDGEAIIMPVRVGEEAIVQTKILDEILKENYKNVKRYVIINKVTQSRISQRLVDEIEKAGFEILADLSYTEIMKWAEKEGKFFWEIKGAGRLPHGVFLKEIAKWFMRGRL
jgi:cellulose biosynthesis protein BcsQ